MYSLDKPICGFVVQLFRMQRFNSIAYLCAKIKSAYKSFRAFITIKSRAQKVSRASDSASRAMHSFLRGL